MTCSLAEAFSRRRSSSLPLGFMRGQIYFSIDIIPLVLNDYILLFSAIFNISILKYIFTSFTIFFCDFELGDVVSYLKRIPDA